MPSPSMGSETLLPHAHSATQCPNLSTLATLTLSCRDDTADDKNPALPILYREKTTIIPNFQGP